MSTEQSRPTLADIANLAHELGVQFAAHETTFDLDHISHRIEGTYRKSPAGIETAYRDLTRFRLLVRDIQQGGPTVVHLALDCQQLPDDIATFLKAMMTYLDDQDDPTGLKVSHLRERAKNMCVTFEHIDGLLAAIEQRDKTRRKEQQNG
jgi:hypothetical protein